MQVTLYTIGHSNRQRSELMAILQGRHIETLVDVRASPRSKHNPQFNKEDLQQVCEQQGLIYHWAGRQLGGRRPVAADSPHTALEQGLRGFADYMETDEFVRAANQLITLAAKRPTAIMCAEYDPAQCHRSLIADYLTLQGHEIIHLVSDHDATAHQLHNHARRDSTRLIYDRYASGELDLN